MRLLVSETGMEQAAQSKLYRRRRPELTVAYRALAHHFERFLQVYEDRFEPAFGYLRAVVKKAVYRYLDCGLLEQGFARLRCEGCGQGAVVAFSCKQRCICASCHQKRELLWAEWARRPRLPRSSSKTSPTDKSSSPSPNDSGSTSATIASSLEGWQHALGEP